MKHLFTPRRFFYFCLLSSASIFSINLNALSCNAVSNGNWSNPATWSCGAVPTDNDTLTIPSGIIVTVDVNSPTYANLEVDVFGTLNFDNGMKLNFCPGNVCVFMGGMLTGGTPGSKINCCGTTEWNGGTSTAGPATFPDIKSTLVVSDVVPSKTTMSSNSTSRMIHWSTTNELSHDYFTIERSENGMSYMQIGKVDGMGNSNEKREYSFTDMENVPPTCYYRITQTSENGISKTSNTIAFNNSENPGACMLKVFPNPCFDQCQINFADCPQDNDGIIKVEMIDANGTVVSSQIAEQTASGSFNLAIDRNDNLKPGVYIVRGTSSKNAYTQKAVLK